MNSTKQLSILSEMNRRKKAILDNPENANFFGFIKQHYSDGWDAAVEAMVDILVKEEKGAGSGETAPVIEVSP